MFFLHEQSYKSCRSSPLLFSKEQPNLTQVPISFFLYKDSRLFQTSKKPPTGSPDLNVTLREAILSQVIAATLEIDNVVVENLPPNSSVISRFQLSEVSLIGSEIKYKATRKH